VVKTFQSVITETDAFNRFSGQAAVATHEDGVTEVEKFTNLDPNIIPFFTRITNFVLRCVVVGFVIGFSAEITLT